MRKSMRGSVSPALVISIIALVLAAGGTSLASAPVAFIAKAVGLNGKQKKQAKSIADKEIKGKASKLSVLFAQSAGSAASAASAATAGSATSAVSALNATNATNATNAGNANTVAGEAVQKFFFTSAEATTPLKTVAQFGTFTLQARCNGTVPDLELTSSEANWGSGGTMTDVEGGTGKIPADHTLFRENLKPGANLDLTAGGRISGGYVTASTPAGHNITIIYHVDAEPTLGAKACLESGVAIGS
jgi:hypothetical protein